jgi:hypothetical protein
VLEALLWHHWADLTRIARAKLPPGDPVRMILQNANVSTSCTDLLAVFDPVANALDLMQRDKCTLAESVEIWIEFK